jgi:spermidine synthase
MSSALAHFHDTGSLRIEAAEIDPVAIAAGREHFGMDDSEDWLEIFPVDGRVLLETAPKDRLYDVVIVDAYSSSYYVPFHLTTVEFFRLVKRHLRPGGVLAFNVFAPRNDDPLLRALENTCATAFDRVWNVPVSGFPNFVILATPSASDIPFAGFVHAVNSEKFVDIRERTEGVRFLERAAAAFHDVHRVEPDGDLPVLTDDRAPAEQLRDDGMRRYHRIRQGNDR